MFLCIRLRNIPKFMLSRRNIRIKIMHLLYAKRQDATLGIKEIKTRYKQSVEQSYNLYLFFLWQLIKITEIAKEDAAKRAAKHLPTEEDKKFTPKFCNNEIVQSIVNNEYLIKELKKRNIPTKVDHDMSRLFYSDFAKTEEYKAYLNKNNEDILSHKEALLTLLKFSLGDESFQEYIDEKYDNWIHDKSLIIGAIKRTLKSLPNNQSFYQEYLPAKETTEEFGEDLLHKSNHFDDDLLQIIKPALKNWEADRVALIDLILLKLALCELIYFPTIPVKVTINEYVDISKIYSTPKSKDFINGILDRLMKKLTKEGNINKQGRGLID